MPRPHPDLSPELARKLAQLAVHTDSAILVGDAQGFIEWVNDAFERLSGIAREEVVGKRLGAFPTAAEVDAAAADRIRTRILQGETARLELAVKQPGGARVWVELEVQPLRDRRGEVQDFIAVAQDVTERKQAQSALVESELRYRTLVEQSPNAVLVHREGKIVYANFAAVRLWGGARADELVGRSVLEMIHPESREQAVLRMRAVEQKGITPEVIEGKVLRHDGSTAKVLVHTAPLVLDGRPAVQALLVDMTDRERQEEERRQLQARVQETYRVESLGVLARGIAHELGELSSAIVESVDRALGRRPDEGEAPLLRRARKAGLRTAELASQLLTFEGRVRFLAQPLDLSAFLLEISDAVEAEAGERLKVHWDLAANLPAAEADAVQIRQLVIALVRNAAEAHAGASGRITLSTGLVEVDAELRAELHPQDALEPGRYLALEVRDDGRGMDAATAQRIFEPFFSTKGAGRGLGLATALGLVRAHSGAFRVQSRPRHGTRMTVLLPCAVR